MKITFIFILIFVVIYSCNPIKSSDEKDSCRVVFIEIADRFNEIELKKFIGLSISPRGIEKDSNGKRYIRSLLYTSEDKKQFSVNSNQVVNGNQPNQSTKDRRVAFSRAYGIDIDELDVAVLDLVNIFDKFGVKEIKSQLHHGEFVEVIVDDNCSVWYKPQNAKVTDEYAKFFSAGEKIARNWYIINVKSTSSILKEHPPNVKL